MAVPGSVIAGIVNGEWDEDLTRISEAIQSRRQEIRRRALFLFAPGDRIVGVGGRNSGDGWAGIRGVFVKKRETKVLVRMDPGQRSKWSGREVVCPPDMIQKEETE